MPNTESAPNNCTQGFPNPVWEHDYGYPADFAWDRFDCGTIAAEINDSQTLSRPEKERRIKLLFKSRGIKVKFVGKYRPGPRTV